MQRTDPAEKLRAPLAVQETGQAASKTPGDASYQGLVALLAQYVIGASEAEKKVEYPKGAISILSRMDLGSLVETILKTSPEKLVEDVLELVSRVKPAVAMPSLIKDILVLEATLQASTAREAWLASVDTLFKTYEKKIDSEKLNDLKRKTSEDWAQRHTVFKNREKNILKRFDKLEEPLFSEEARKNIKIPVLTARAWLEDLAINKIDQISWGFGAPTKTQTGGVFGFEAVGEEGRPGAPLEVRSLEKAHHTQWRALAEALVGIVREINATQEPVAPDRRAREATPARRQKTQEAPSRLADTSTVPKNQAGKLDLRKSL